jgi:hypothetical protein
LYRNDAFAEVLAFADAHVNIIHVDEVGAKPGEFNIVFKASEINADEVVPSLDDLVIEGPFGLVESTDVLFPSGDDSSLCVRSDALVATRAEGKVHVKIDLDMIGAMIVTMH